jgi:hypothetical protein
MRAAEPATTAAPVPQAKKVEVCFVLDTTGSMGGLIEGAKRKIWSIANGVASAKPTPKVKFGLIGYRDRGDEYVTKAYDLTEDLDAIYEKLQQFKADGGGDTPESVNQALSEAVTKMSWSTNREVLKIVFLVGDCPPHMDYKDDVKYPETCEAAVRKDLIVNTVQCGNSSETTPIWTDIARRGEGSFVAIGQTGDMVVIATPMDGDIAKLNAELAGTRWYYGDADRAAREVAHETGMAASAPAPAAAERSLFMAKKSEVRRDEYKARPSALAADAKDGRAEMLDAVEAGAVKVADLEAEKLPDAMKKMSKEEREKYVADQLAKRKDLQTKLSELSKQRAAFIEEEKKKGAGKKDSFDEQVGSMIREQAKRKGISYE